MHVTRIVNSVLLHDVGALYTLHISNGVVVAVEKQPPAAGAPLPCAAAWRANAHCGNGVVDAGAAIVVPGLTQAHMHIDKCHLLSRARLQRG